MTGGVGSIGSLRWCHSFVVAAVNPGDMHVLGDARQKMEVPAFEFIKDMP